MCNWKLVIIGVVIFFAGSVVGAAMLGGVAFATTVTPQFFGISNENGSRVAGGRFQRKIPDLYLDRQCK